MKKGKIEFKPEHATKSTSRFHENSSGEPTNVTLYVHKSAFDGKEPKKVKVAKRSVSR